MPFKIRNYRFVDLLTRLFDREQGPLELGAASPGIALETEDGQELDLLRGWRRYGQFLFQGPTAGQFSEFALDNPGPSRTLIRVEMLWCTSLTGADTFTPKVSFGLSFGGWSDQGAGGPLDARNRTVGGFPISAGHIWARSTAAATGGSRFGIIHAGAGDVNKNLYASRAESRVVLDPGTTFLVATGTVNSQSRIGIVWAERSIEKSELLPVL
jgi:hypothetical protein